MRRAKEESNTSSLGSQALNASETDLGKTTHSDAAVERKSRRRKKREMRFSSQSAREGGDGGEARNSRWKKRNRNKTDHTRRAIASNDKPVKARQPNEQVS
jgi:hypothetical protein